MSTPSNTPSTHPVEGEAVHADSSPDTFHIPTQRDLDSEDLPETVTNEEDAFETDDESMESDADDAFSENGVSLDEEVMEDEGGIAGAETRPTYLR
jgi:hypothetical protein